MRVKRSVKKSFAVLLVPAAVVATVQLGGAVAAGASGQPAASIAENQGNPNAVPPILRPATPLELAALEAWEGQEFSADPPSHGRYSMAEMNAYASARR